MSTALLPVTLSMLCAGMAGIFLVLGVLVAGASLFTASAASKKKVKKAATLVELKSSADSLTTSGIHTSYITQRIG